MGHLSNLPLVLLICWVAVNADVTVSASQLIALSLPDYIAQADFFAQATPWSCVAQYST